MSPRVGGLVLAAGEGRRFGGVKQLARVGGIPILQRVLRAMEGVPELHPLVVVLGARADEVRAGIELGAFRAVVARDWASGQAASLRAGVAALGAVDEVLVCLGDMPLVTSSVIAGTVGHGAPGAAAVRASYGGVPGHPVLLRRPVLVRLGELAGDVGARELLAALPVDTFEAGHLCDPTDVDTREQLEALTR